jgi:uncharacterized iron-regulated membrane protein
MRLPTLLLRRLHKWIGLLIGLQLVLWTLSGAAMSFLDHHQVQGGETAAPSDPPLPLASAWNAIRATGTAESISAMTLRPLLGRHVYELATPAGVRLVDAETGRAVVIDQRFAAGIAAAAHPGGAPIRSVSKLSSLELAVREHALPIWRVDFRDDRNSSYYVSATTGKLLERRNDAWRWFDFVWMLHNMDYVNRTSFNHPYIVVAGLCAFWLALSGALLLFRTAWRPDLRALGRFLRRARPRN